MVPGFIRMRAANVSGLHRFQRISKTILRYVGLVAATAGLVSCGGSPGGPAPIPQPQNQAPVITSVDVEPARIEVNEEVTVRATVQDAETAATSLVYEWAADVGTFSGEGATVTWKAPADAAAPVDVTIRLTVRERYGQPNAAGVQPEHVVTASSGPVRVHDSPRELEDMAIKFLELFADSNLDADECLVDFANSCVGKEREREDIEANRTYYEIRSSSFDFDDLEIASDRLFARMVVECEFRSRVRRCPPENPACVVGATEEASGDCLLTAVYENGRWWLCDSTFDPDEGPTPTPLRFFGPPSGR